MTEKIEKKNGLRWDRLFKIGSFYLIIIGISVFLIGIHNIDLSYTVLRISNDMETSYNRFYDQPLFNVEVAGYNELYLTGLNEIITGTFMVFIGCLIFT